MDLRQKLIDLSREATGDATITVAGDFQPKGLTWKVAGVTDVLNEIQISDAGFLNTAKDAWITTQLTSKITLDQDILAINYSVETVNGIVYLIGIAQSQAELDRVAAYARNISYVRKIISHVRVKTGTAKKS